MAQSRPTITKRQRERKMIEKRQQKAERRAQRKIEREDREPSRAGDVDPDIAHIVPGPQAVPEDHLAVFFIEDEEEEEEGK